MLSKLSTRLIPWRLKYGGADRRKQPVFLLCFDFREDGGQWRWRWNSRQTYAFFQKPLKDAGRRGREHSERTMDDGQDGQGAGAQEQPVLRASQTEQTSLALQCTEIWKMVRVAGPKDTVIVERLRDEFQNLAHLLCKHVKSPTMCRSFSEETMAFPTSCG